MAPTTSSSESKQDNHNHVKGASACLQEEGEVKGATPTSSSGKKGCLSRGCSQLPKPVCRRLIQYLAVAFIAVAFIGMVGTLCLVMILLSKNHDDDGSPIIEERPRRPPTLFILVDDFGGIHLDRAKSYSNSDEYGGSCLVRMLFCPHILRYNTNNGAADGGITNWNTQQEVISLSWLGPESHQDRWFIFDQWNSFILLFDKRYAMMRRVYANLVDPGTENIMDLQLESFARIFNPAAISTDPLRTTKGGINTTTTIKVHVFEAEHYATTILFRDPNAPSSAWEVVCPGVLFVGCFDLLKNSLRVAQSVEEYDDHVGVPPPRPPQHTGGKPWGMQPPTFLSFLPATDRFGNLSLFRRETENDGVWWACRYGSQPFTKALVDKYEVLLPQPHYNSSMTWISLFAYWYGKELWPSIQEGGGTTLLQQYWWPRSWAALANNETNDSTPVVISYNGQPMEAWIIPVAPLPPNSLSYYKKNTVLRFDDPNGFGGWEYRCSFGYRVGDRDMANNTYCWDLFLESSFIELNEDDYDWISFYSY